MANSKFTAEEAFDASESGEPIVLDLPFVERLIAQHDAESLATFHEDTKPIREDAFGRRFYDAGDVLRWLGY